MKKSTLSKLLRINSFVVLVILFQFCATKTSYITGGVSQHKDVPQYEENLSIYRIEYQQDDLKETFEEPVVIKPDILPTNHIRMELDSIDKIMVSQNQDVEYLDGFTIQIYSGNDRDKANGYKWRAKELMYGITPKVSYEQPNYKVRVGQYLDRMEANADYQLIKSVFSRAVLIPYRIRIDQFLSGQ